MNLSYHKERSITMNQNKQLFPAGQPVKIIRSRRKTMALEITKNAEILVRAPYGMPDSEIERFLKEKRQWIIEKLQLIREKQRERQEREATINKLTMDEIQALADKALQIIPERVAYFAPQIGVTYGRITIRNQRTRWGSCSGKGNLNFNCLLMLTPPEIIDYVVVHELCHRKQMNHSPAFWAEVEKILPDYKERRLWLKKNGGALIERMG